MFLLQNVFKNYNLISQETSSHKQYFTANLYILDLLVDALWLSILAVSCLKSGW
jgi:hypothetical protein